MEGKEYFNKLKSEHFFKSIRFTAFLLLGYFALCSTIYDPIVLVDDTPRKPFFKSVLTSSGGNFIHSTARHKISDRPERQESDQIAVPVKRVALQSLPFFLCLLFLTILIQEQRKLFLKSLLIRAPSI
ncbi:MAG: hypothetical protein CME64_03130 [Halobacteriovoraceae bacterium]|nr:hypothetical protein [Halobacteriovoraceae bacterium]|tara:strand:+ start:20369 stop:20752 length:384 start_codon:yes stop_codon:yes gene_type:complete